MLIDIKTGKVVNNSASVEIVFDPPECFFRDPNCLSYYTLIYQPENTTNPTVTSREFTKLDAVEATEKPNRMVRADLNLIFYEYIFQGTY